ncbi:Single-stranded nucleic acid binding R3H domain protein [Alteracholeplasma palmae J233]|uniref:RNA-binding protein KhpB n=1 Tax=Alteracholeplasma palmae (strain ATCC 49389 / J233) TaxID=1318466 RepID=U4KQR0_ALTPJ|nr:RNA-binding cell elongation regulator Jag/EloR [Alteracholeplasma palmae]CCV65015.1 Single-stranded nucleic acid binding R3H domain protein [Alteracholeplasma palmae J233]
MFKKIEFEAKTLSDAHKKATEALRVSVDKIKLTVLKEKKGILGIGASTLYLAEVDIDLATEGKKYLDDILSALEIETKMEMRSLNGNEFYYRIESEHNALLIGKEGKTLLSLQTILRSYLSTYTESPIRVTLDIGNYNENRKKQLEILATKTAKRVIQTKKEVVLEPMSSFDRRVVHSKLSDWRDVETESRGEGENRRLVIKLKK